MRTYILRRLLQSVFVLLAMSILVFSGVYAIGDPVVLLISPQADQADIARTVAELGLDKPLWQQYLRFLRGALQGDLGNSFVYGAPALQLIVERMPATLELAIGAMLLAVVLGIPLGLWAGLRPRGVADRLIMAVSTIGFSLPTFWIGLMLIMLFSVQWGLLPSSGRGPTTELLGIPVSFLSAEGLRHLLLPTLTLSLLNIALVIRLTRAGAQEALLQDYLRFARAKGLSDIRIVGVHVLKNILIPVITVMALQFGSIVAFAIVTESIYAWPGMGKLIIDSILQLDRPVVIAYLLLIVVLFVVVNLLVDIVYGLLDPRIRLSSGPE